MQNPIDFILPTCPGVPDSMWMVMSAMLQVMINVCWGFFKLFVPFKLIWVGVVDVANGKIDVRTHVKTMLQAVLIAILLAHYKFLIMYFDRFIDMFCISENDVATQISVYLKDSAAVYDQEFKAYTEGKNWFYAIKVFFKVIFDLLPKMLMIFVHGGAVKLMHYLKVMVLLPTILLGPFSAILTFLPGPLKKGFSSWVKSYINITSWAITLHIFSILTKYYSGAAFWIKSHSAASLVGESVGHVLLSIGLLVAIFLTPTFTSKLLGGAIVANVGNALNMASGKMGLGRRLAKSLTNKK